MGILDCFKSGILITLCWIVDPSLKQVAQIMNGNNIGDFLDNFRIIISTATTVIIFTTALIRYLKERKKKKK